MTTTSKKKEEQWADISDFFDHYKYNYHVSDQGRVRLWGADDKGNIFIRGVKQYTRTWNRRRRREVDLEFKNGNTISWDVAVLVLETFMHVKPEYPTPVIHLDGNPLNNRLENLNWLHYCFGMFNKSGEQWTGIKGLYGHYHYQVSNHGCVRGYIEKIQGKPQWFLVEHKIDMQGYHYARFWDKHGFAEIRYIAELVYEAFKGSVPRKMLIDFIDGDLDNNCLDNLTLVKVQKRRKQPHKTTKNHDKDNK